MLSPSTADQAVFFATHEIEPNDERLLLRYKTELDAVPLWVLYLRPKSRQPLALQRLRTAGVPNFVWSRHKIGSQLPSLAAALARAERDNASAYSQTPEPNLKLYFFMHSALLLWLRAHGSSYPRLRYMWRLEPDVLFAGPLAQLVSLAAQHVATTDVLLPKLWLQENVPRYVHWARHGELLARLAPENRTYSLVSAGRFSVRFISEILAPRWEADEPLAFEEIGIPAACTLAGARCSMATISLATMRVPTRNFRYRPEWSCDEYLAARAWHAAHGLWHPVKNRSCLSAIT